EGRALPEGILSPEICLQWRQQRGAGAGLYNLGETCFINSVLQCLTYTPPLANYFLSRVHSRSCQQRAFCMMCTMEAHICDVLPSTGSALFPLCVLDNLQCKSHEDLFHVFFQSCSRVPLTSSFIGTGEHFLYGRQEDAHEFLCFLLLAMQTACLPGSDSLDSYSPSTTIVQQIFEGLLRSRLTCLSCGAVSNSYEAFLDVPLNIGGASSVGAALQDFVQPERLDGANCVKCRRCNAVAAASKGFSIQDEPKVLTLSLKRFDVRGRKLHKAVQFPLNLDLRPYMSQPKGEPCLYSLYAVLVHKGGTSGSGHYFCYIKAGDGLWYRMDDTSVTPCAVDEVLQQQAYLLFYVR
ncbi:UBP42 hydrolase, partial [Psilopogon haemacephalus]|nr:UBP42 hydrolase [Psilopogon haemacephalus]